MTPALVQPLADGIRDAEAVVFDDSAHTATAEGPQRYREVLAAFLRRVEGGESA
jgi:pimeloyl-ACP methyl ester carboxylesterase